MDGHPVRPPVGHLLRHARGKFRLDHCAPAAEDTARRLCWARPGGTTTIGSRLRLLHHGHLPEAHAAFAAVQHPEGSRSRAEAEGLGGSYPSPSHPRSRDGGWVRGRCLRAKFAARTPCSGRSLVVSRLGPSGLPPVPVASQLLDPAEVTLPASELSDPARARLPGIISPGARQRGRLQFCPRRRWVLWRIRLSLQFDACAE